MLSRKPRIPQLDVLPYMTEMVDIIHELHMMEDLINKNKQREGANYIMMRLVTILESTLRYLTKMDPKDHMSLDIPIMTLRTALKDRYESPNETIDRLLALSQRYQNIYGVREFLNQNEPVDDRDPVSLSDGEWDCLDELFKKRHRIVHSVDALVLEIDDLRAYYKLVSGLVERFIEAYWPPGLLWAKADVHEKLGEPDEAKKCYESFIQRIKQSYTTRPDKRSLNDAVGIVLAYCSLDRYEDALNMLEDTKLFEEPEFYNLRAEILMNLGRLDEAENVLRCVPNLFDEPDLLRTMAEIRLRCGDKNMALEYAMRMLATPESRLEACEMLADVYKEIGQDSLVIVLRNIVEGADEPV